MYVLHRRRQRNRTILALSLLVIGIGGVGYLGRQLITTETTIGPAPAATVTRVQDNRKAPKQFNEALFSFELPADWEKFAPTEVLAGSQSWRNTADNKGIQTLTIFTDVAPRSTAVNRIVVAQPADGGGMILAGDVSDNCINFTNSGQRPTGSGTATAKWEGVDFLCDTGNYVRNLVAVGTVGTPAGIKLIGQTAGQHGFFITYNDNNSSPKFDVFTAMLQSFKLR